MRRDASLGPQYRAILSYTGLVFVLGGLAMWLPLLAPLLAPGGWGHAAAFLLPGAALSGLGLGLWRLLRRPEGASLGVREGGVIVLLSWLGICLFSAIPFWVAGGLGFTQGVFESVSGWTTTGLTVIDEEAVPPMILLWRSVMQLGGGAGLAIIMVAALAGPRGPGLYQAEGRSQLVPHVRRSARLVVTLYAGYALLGCVGLYLAGMGVFDAVNHAFAAVSTGGFSTRSASLGHWDSAPVEAVTIVLMLLGSLNFVTAYMLVRGRWRVVARNGELTLLAALLGLGVLVMLFAVAGVYAPGAKRVRVAVFETVSALTTTGFTSTTYAGWAPVGFWLMVVLMIVGGGTCSTAGGLKQFRVHLMLKALWWKMHGSVQPAGVVEQPYIWDGERKDYVGPERLAEVGAFCFLYLFVLVLGTGVLAASGYSLQDSLFEFASALGTVGLSRGVIAAEAPTAVLWASIAGMLLGRLEFLIIFLSLAKVAADLRHALATWPGRR